MTSETVICLFCDAETNVQFLIPNHMIVISPSLLLPKLPSCSFRSWIMGIIVNLVRSLRMHDDVIKWKHFPRNWPFVREIHRSPVNFPHKGQWRGALTFSLIYARINDWVNNRGAGDLRRQHGHYDVIVMDRVWCWRLITSRLFHWNREIWKSG